MPDQFALSQNYPNPFNMETTFEYQVPKAASIELRIFNVLGQEIRTLAAGDSQPGYFKVNWDGRDYTGRFVDSGVYIIKLHAGNFGQSRKVIVLIINPHKSRLIQNLLLCTDISD